LNIRKGLKNAIADALSRKEHNLLAISSFTPAWIQEIEQSYEEDTFYNQIIQQVLIDVEAVQHYTVHSGGLRYKGRVCIDSSNDLRNKILTSLHSSPIEGHSGITATYQRIKMIFHWPQLKKSVELFVSECRVYQRDNSEYCQYPWILCPFLIWLGPLFP
jgi:hypothetical protein